MEQTKDAMAASLRGQHYTVPDLRHIFAGWPIGRKNGLENELRPIVDQTIEGAIPDEKKRARMKKADLAHFVSLWHPDAQWDQLCVVVGFYLWIFLWDDTYDSGAGIDSDESDKTFSQACEDLLRFVESCLDSNGVTDAAVPPDQVSGSLKDAALAFGKYFTPAQRARFLESLKFYVGSVKKERVASRSPLLPRDKNEYLDIRLGTCGADVFCSISEYMTQTRLPESVANSEEASALVNKTGLCFTIVNDLLSFPKEVAAGSVFNLVAVELQASGSLQVAVANLVEALQKARKEFDVLAAGMRKNLTRTGRVDEMLPLQSYINSCEAKITGTITYTIESPRYGIRRFVNEGGELDVTL